VERRRLVRRAGGGIAAVAAVAAFGMVIFWLWTAFWPPQPAVRPAETPVGVPVEPRVTATIPVGAFPENIAVGEGAVWVTVDDSGGSDAWLLERIDPATGEVTGRVELPDAGDVAVGEGAVWVATWSSGRPALLRIDPVTMDVSAVIPLHGQSPDQVVVGFGEVWVTVHGSSRDETDLVEVDPGAGEVVRRIAVPGDARDLAVTDDVVWVVSLTYAGQVVDGADVYRVPANGEEAPMPVIEGATPLSGIYTPTVVTAGFDAVWTNAGDTQEVGRVDPDTGAVMVTPIDRGFLPFGAGEGGIWFGQAGDDPVISRLNPETMEVDAEVPLEGIAVDAALDPESGTIWVANYQHSVTRIELRP
jgi:streptogramin lyase